MGSRVHNFMRAAFFVAEASLCKNIRTISMPIVPAPSAILLLAGLGTSNECGWPAAQATCDVTTIKSPSVPLRPEGLFCVAEYCFRALAAIV
jgi:hypothetical protein